MDRRACRIEFTHLKWNPYFQYYMAADFEFTVISMLAAPGLLLVTVGNGLILNW